MFRRIYNQKAIDAALHDLENGSADVNSAYRFPRGLIEDLKAFIGRIPPRLDPNPINVPIVLLRHPPEQGAAPRLAKLTMEWIRRDSAAEHRDPGGIYAAKSMANTGVGDLWVRGLDVAKRWAEKYRLSIPSNADIRWKVTFPDGGGIDTLEGDSAAPAFLTGLHHLSRRNTYDAENHRRHYDGVRKKLENRVLLFGLPDVPINDLEPPGEPGKLKRDFLQKEYRNIDIVSNLDAAPKGTTVHRVSQFIQTLDRDHQHLDSSIYLRFLLWSLKWDGDSGDFTEAFRGHAPIVSAIITGQVPHFHDNKEREEFHSGLQELLEKHGFDKIAGKLRDFISLDNKIRRIEFLYGGHVGVAKTLRRLLTNYQEYLKMTAEWERTCSLSPTLARSLADGQDETGLNVVEDLYTTANLKWTTVDTDAFTAGHFEQEVWQEAIARCQPDENVKPATHINCANLWLAQTLTGRDESGFILPALEPILCDSRPSILRIVEGGVGGLNTFYSLCRSLRTRSLRAGQPCPRLRYLGIELNPAYLEMASQFLSGIGDDKRAELFNEMKPGQVVPNYQKGRLVLDGNMARIVSELVLDSDVRGTLDLFLSAYAIHHVPNPVRIQRFFSVNQRQAAFERDSKVLPRSSQAFHTLSEEEKDNLIVKLREGISRQRRGENPLRGDDSSSSRLARVILSHLPFRPKEKDVPNYLAAADYLSDGELLDIQNDLDSGKPKFDWIEHSLADRQYRLFSDVFQLLRPGGVLAIADPDGYSMFNRQMITISAEMAVAYFRTRAEVESILRSIGYEILSALTQIKSTAEGGFAVALSESADSSATLQDSNLGYIIIARRPFV
jgi:SAM-dependent methyltransferase